MQLWLLVTLAFATSLDSLGVGVAYGLSKTRVQSKAHACISVVMFVITWASVALGNQIAHVLPAFAAKVIGALLFGVLGIWLLAPLARRNNRVPGLPPPCRPDRAPSLTALLHNPQLADRDASRDIDLREALLLGMALSLNNIGGGVSAGLIRLNAVEMAGTSVLFNILFLWGGHLIGGRLGQSRLSACTQAVSGVLLLIVGALQLR